MATFNRIHDAATRSAAFEWLAHLMPLHGEVLPSSVLRQGFEIRDQRVCVVGPQGIFKPASMQAPLSITTSPNGPYDDAFDPSGRLRYRYRGTNPDHHENVGLRFARDNHLPLVYFHGILSGRYLAIWPVYVVEDSPATLTFLIEVDDGANLHLAPQEARPRRLLRDDVRYVTTLTRHRVHQTAFRERVLRAYRTPVCNLQTPT